MSRAAGPPNAELDADTREALGQQVDRYQAVVDRLASTSRQIKTISVTFAGALGVLAGTIERSQGALAVGAAVMGAFALLDAHYLALERCARRAQAAVVDAGLARGSTDWRKLLVVNVPRPTAGDIGRALSSPTVILFYGAPGVALLAAWLA